MLHCFYNKRYSEFQFGAVGTHLIIPSPTQQWVILKLRMQGVISRIRFNPECYHSRLLAPQLQGSRNRCCRHAAWGTTGADTPSGKRLPDNLLTVHTGLRQTGSRPVIPVFSLPLHQLCFTSRSVPVYSLCRAVRNGLKYTFQDDQLRTQNEMWPNQIKEAPLLTVAHFLTLNINHKELQKYLSQ